MPSSPSMKSIVIESIIPKLHEGIYKGRVTLTDKDCEGLILILSQSVDIEPLIRCFHDLIGQTLANFKPHPIDDDEEG